MGALGVSNVRTTTGPPLTHAHRIHVITRTYDYGLVSTFLSETLGLFTLFVLWLVGAAIATVRPPLAPPRPR